MGWPQFHAACAALASVSGCCAIAWICLASSLAVNLSWRIDRAPPAATISRALAAWWSSVAIGSGTRIAGRPTAVSSAIVEAPARPMNRCASASRVGHVLEIGAELGRDVVAGVALAHRVEVLGAALLGDLQARAQRRREHRQAVGHDFGQHPRALAAAGDQHAQQAVLGERRERLVAQRQHFGAHRIADEVDLAACLGASRSTSG